MDSLGSLRSRKKLYKLHSFVCVSFYLSVSLYSLLILLHTTQHSHTYTEETKPFPLGFSMLSLSLSNLLYSLPSSRTQGTFFAMIPCFIFLLLFILCDHFGYCFASLSLSLIIPHPIYFFILIFHEVHKIKNFYFLWDFGF